MAVLHGSCFCGLITYESATEPTLTALCHCRDCQKRTGSAFSSNAVVPEEAFKVTKGTPKKYTGKGASGNTNYYYFCDVCGSSVYTTLNVMPGCAIIKAGGLDGGKASLDGKIQVELYCKDKVSYLGAVEGAKQEAAFGDAAEAG